MLCEKTGTVALLIVIVVIAILAIISVVTYSGIQNTAQSDLANFAKLIEVQRAESETYPATLTPAMGFKFSKGSYGEDYQGSNVRYCYNVVTGSYVLYTMLY